MKISKYVTKYEIGEYNAYYHSLRMKPVYLSKMQSLELENALIEKRKPNLDPNILESLEKYYIMVESDDNVLNHIQKYAPKPYISLAYFILSEQCNLACKYCFLGNSDIDAKKITNFPMNEKVADKALEFFAKQTQKDNKQFDDEKEIIFYGGEPLLNFKILKYIVERSKYYQEKNLLSKKLNFSIVTNGLLLDDEKILYLRDHNINVSISIDGADVFANSNRIDKKGKCIYDKLIKKLKYAKKLGLEFGISVTLTENSICDINKLLKLIEEIDIKSVCFNILLSNESYEVDKHYYIDATDFIIEFYKQTKNKGIYEERFMRKLKSFAESNIYFSDCAATSGSQIVITPDGDVGICHGCTQNRDYFIGSIFDNDLVVDKNKDIIKWSKLIPIFKSECETCSALGICGGGCPINAQNLSDTHSIEDIDKAFCIHAQNTLKFLIEELLRLLLNE